MKVSPASNSQSFMALNMENVMVLDRKMLIHKKELSKLRELAERYDIKLTSVYSEVPDFSCIEVVARPLKKGLNFFKRLFRPVGISVYPDRENNVSERTIVSAAEEAIENLNKKIAAAK